jgi:hypothetical protein
VADDRIIYDVAHVLLDCALDALVATSYGAPARAYVNVGIPAHDDCCDGQLTVTIPRRFRSSTFPDPDDRVVQCGGGLLALSFQVEIVRCWPGTDDNGDAPTVEQLEAASLQQMVEGRAVYAALECCLYEYRNVWMSLLGDQTDVGPEGMCAGSVTNGYVGFIPAEAAANL